MRQHLEICARNFGPAPRDLKSLDKKYLLPTPPSWAKTDKLNEVVKNRETLLTQGTIVLSARVMANRVLYYPSTEDSAMEVVWSEDPFFYENSRALFDIALQVGEMRTKKYEPNNDEEKEVVQLVSDEMSRSHSFPLPASITDGRAVFLSSLLVHRKHLAGGILNSVFLPILISPTHTKAAMILPSRFWGDEWKDR